MSQRLIFTAVTIILLTIVGHAQADTVKARCDIYPKGEDRASGTMPCIFSQRQGYISIRRIDGLTIDLEPKNDLPGNFIDQNGKAAFRQSGLGDRGLIFRLADESIFIYWDIYPFTNEEFKALIEK